MIPTAYAQACQAGETMTEIGVCIPNDPAGFVSKLYGAGLGMIGGIGLLFIIYGGYLILTSQGNPMQINKGKSFITYAVVGIFLALSGFGLYQLIARDIVKIPGFN